MYISSNDSAKCRKVTVSFLTCQTIISLTGHESRASQFFPLL